MFQIDPMSRQAVYEQLIEQMERFILSGILKTGDQIPSVRSLSVDLSVNPNTIQKAYSQMDARGMIYSVPGKGCFISPDALERLSKAKMEKMKDFEILIQELALAEITQEQLIESIKNVFSNIEKQNENQK